MTQSSDGEGIDVALDALHSDAKAWRKAAKQLATAREELGTMTLKPDDVPEKVFDTGLDQAYEQARTAMEKALQQAGDYFDELAGKLTTAADQYERDDKASLHEFKHIDQGNP